MDFQEWVTWETLRDLALFTVVVRIIVELTKRDIDRWTGGRLPTMWYCFLVAEAILFAGSLYQGVLDPGNGFLNVVNGFIVVALTKVMDMEQKPAS